MTDRERWTVYPLLFLTLGIAVKDKIVNISNVDTVFCNTLKVHDRQGREEVVITSTPAGGLIRANGLKSGVNVLLGHSEKLAGLLFVDAQGNLHSPSIAIQTPSPRAPATGQSDANKKPPESAPEKGVEAPPDAPQSAPENPTSEER